MTTDGAESAGAFHHSLSSEGRHAVFRKLISDLSQHLQPDEVTRCSFLHNLPKDRTTSALEALEYLMRSGTFSHNNVDPLVELLKDINRHDLVNSFVEPYLNENTNEDGECISS